MQQFNIAEAKARFSQIIRKVLAGEAVVISRDNKPLVKLVPLRSAERRRQPGSARGRVRMSKDFDAPLEEFSDYR